MSQETGLYHPSVGYWQASKKIDAGARLTWPEGTVEVPLSPGLGYTYNGSNWVAPEQSWLDNIASEEARLLRNRKLKKQVDPIVSNTLRWAEFSSEKQQEWVDYRRLLLDITETEGFPNNIAWPEPPQ